MNRLFLLRMRLAFTSVAGSVAQSYCCASAFYRRNGTVSSHAQAAAREWSKFYIVFMNVLLLSSVALGQKGQVTAITDGSQRVQSPRISASNVAWQQYDGHDWEIYLYDG